MSEQVGSQFVNFKPAGPVAAAFLADRQSKVRLLRGPVGGGKTVNCIFDGLMQASAQPVCQDGWIHFRLAVIGATYGQLERNLYPSWKFWLPEDGGGFTPEADWSGGGGRSATHKLEFDIVRNGKRIPVDFSVVFAAIGELSVEQFMRGFEPSAWYLFEVDQLPEGIIEQASGRLGRWPNAKMRVPGQDYRNYVIGDLNAPDIDSWYYKLVEEVRPPGVTQYVQPSGLSPLAENLQNLPEGYYQGLETLNRHKKKWVKRFVRNEYGPTDVGEPVYPEYADEIHLSAERLRFDKSRGIYLGLDQGLTQPAAIIAQRAASGQWRCLKELVPGRMNARRFAKLLRATIEDVAPNVEIIGAWADPAGFDGADKEAGEMAWAETVGNELDVVILPAPSNEIDLRLTSVKDELTYMVDDGKPGLVVCRHGCPMLRKGFASHYMYEKRANEKNQALKPIKNIWSNPHDGLQYLMLGVKGRYGVVSGERSSGRDGAGSGSGGASQVKSSFIDANW